MSVMCEHGNRDRNVYGQCRVCKRRWSQVSRRRRAEAAAAARAVSRLPVPVAGDWVVDAACREYDPDLFYPPKGWSNAEALAVCATCPVLLECRLHAARLRLAGGTNGWHGVWGGLPEKALRRLPDAERIAAETARILGVQA